MTTDSDRQAQPDDATEVAGTVVPRPSSAVPGAPRRVGSYELLEELGRGGAGVVHKACHVGLGKVVALKILEGGSESEVARFVQEARAMAALEHPNVVRVHDVGEALGRWFIVMDFAAGGTLSGVVRTARAKAKKGEPVVAVERALELVEKVARGVAHAHERGIVHRDLKPSNVLVGADGEPLVADFGLARKLDAPEGITQSGQVLGTPCYMPPEQARGEPVDVRADVYTLGAILQELVTGDPPLPSTGRVALDLARAATGERTPPRQRMPALPVDLETILLRALALDPAERYPTALAFAEDVARLRRGDAIEAKRPSLATRAARWARVRRVTLALCGLLALSIVATGLLMAEKLADLRSWEEVGRFDGATLAGWESLDGTWTVEGGALRGQGRPARLAFAKPIAGDVRVDYVACLQSVTRVGGDLSLEILSESSLDEDTGYFVGFASGGNKRAQLTRRGRRVAFLEGATAEPGRTYRIRVERDGTTIRLAVDGRVVLEHRDLVPLDLGQHLRVSLYSWDADARFSSVVVSRRSAARRPHRSEVADGLAEKGQFAAAALLYEEAAADPATTADERRELTLKRGLAEVAAASAAPEPPTDGLERAARALDAVGREAAGTELALHAEIGLAECDILKGDLPRALVRARALLGSPLPMARYAVRELVARAETRCAQRARHEERIALLAETRGLFPANTQIGFECDLSHAQSLLELGRAKDAVALLAASAAREKGDPFYEPELLVELAQVHERAGDLAAARAVLARHREASVAASDDQRIRGFVESGLAALDAGDVEGAAPAVTEARRIAERGSPGHAPILALLEARIELARGASGARRRELLASLDAIARAGVKAGATDWIRAWGAQAALAAAASRFEAGDEPAARASLDEATAWPGASAPLAMPAAAALLLAAALDERAGAHDAALRALERSSTGPARAPHFVALARALASGPVAPDAARRLLAGCGDCGRDRALAALVLGLFALARGDQDGAALVREAQADAAPSWIRAIARRAA